ncbi:uncharacterized protein [Populus alba]|uniref:uncharacterized protein isoform X4 n=1 Tax=Populus alba TaxID=43335 RepID=UPI003CC72128
MWRELKMCICTRDYFSWLKILHGVSCLEWKCLCFCAFGSGNERRRTKFLFFKQAECIHHLYLAHHLILKHFKPVDIMLMMDMVLQILHHVFFSLCTRSPFELLMGQNFLVRLTLFAHCTTWSCAWEPTEELRNALEKEILKSKFVLIALQLAYTATQMPQ